MDSYRIEWKKPAERELRNIDKTNFVAQVLDGLKDAENGRLLTPEQLLDRVEKWVK